jgi:hypothetical protein
VHGPIPLTPTAAIASDVCSRSSRVRDTNSDHQISIDISTNPGLGRDTLWLRVALATMRPRSSTTTPLLLEVPISIPRYPDGREFTVFSSTWDA